MFNFSMHRNKWCLVKGLKIGKERDAVILDLGENRKLQACFLGELVRCGVRDLKSFNLCSEKKE